MPARSRRNRKRRALAERLAAFIKGTAKPEPKQTVVEEKSDEKAPEAKKEKKSSKKQSKKSEKPSED